MIDFFMNTIQPLIEALIPVVVMIATAYATAYIRNKWGMEVKESQLKALQDMAINAIYSVEEKAMRDAAEGISNKVKGWKHGAAVDKFLAMAPDIDKKQAEEIIENIVARLPDIGAFKK